MANHALSTSRRTLLGAPLAVTAIPLAAPAAAAVPPAVPLKTRRGRESCFELGVRAARLIREHQMTDRESADEEGRTYAECVARMRDLTDEIDAARSRLLHTPARTASDVVAKLLVAMERIEESKHDVENLSPCEEAEAAVRDCVAVLARLSGTSLIDLAADWTDRELCIRLEPELKRVLPAIYAD